MKWYEQRLLAFDTETTGLQAHRQDRVIEFGGVELFLDANYDVLSVKKHEFLIDPNMPIPREASIVTGLRDEDVRGKPRFSELAPKIWDLLDGAICIAHNFSFDFGFLRSEFRRVGKDWPKTMGEVDTLDMARRFMPDLRSKRLEKVAEELGVPLINAHRATDDAEACGRVFAAMAQQCKEVNPEGGRAIRGRAPADLREMLQWAQAYMQPPENDFIGLVDSGVPAFLSGPHQGELIENHTDYLQWMTMAKKRVDGQWMDLYSAPVREWIDQWLRAKVSGQGNVTPRVFGRDDWQSVEPVEGIYHSRGMME